jgi:hypothetical protein
MSSLSVYLDDMVNNLPEKYKLNVLNVKEDEIVAFLSGGISGAYKLRINKDGIGNSDSSFDFFYQILH